LGAWRVDHEVVYNLWLILRTMLGKLKLKEAKQKLRILKFLFYFSLFQCTSHQPVSVDDLD
jgi:hypothetical protein